MSEMPPSSRMALLPEALVLRDSPFPKSSEVAESLTRTQGSLRELRS